MKEKEKRRKEGGQKKEREGKMERGKRRKEDPLGEDEEVAPFPPFKNKLFIAPCFEKCP